MRWADLSHAYGPADDVPELLRGLTDADPEVRADAIDELYGNIWHQGTVYSSTAYAVPFLARIVADRSVANRASVLGLLASISAGSGYVQVHRQFMQRWSAPDPRELDDQEVAEEQWVSAARNAVIDAGPGLLDLLDDDDVEVRRTLPYALGGLPEIAGVLAPRLASRFSGEPDEAARASIVFGLAALGRGSGDPGLVSPVIEHARRGSDAERLAAAIVDAGSAGQEQSAVAAAIDDFVAAVPGGSDAVDSLAWPRGDGAAGMMVSALGGRPEAEFQLASRMYASADPAMRNRAVSGAGNLARQSRSELAPLLLPNLSSGDEWLQVRSARAYFRLTGDTAAVLPVLLGRASTQPAGIAAVEALGWLGHRASAVAPQLEQWLSQDERAGGISLGGAIEHDENVQEIARTTLAAIRQT